MTTLEDAILLDDLSLLERTIELENDVNNLSRELVRMIDGYDSITPNRLEIARLLISNIVRLDAKALDVDHDGDGSYLHLCVMNYDIEILQLLIEVGVDTEVKNDMGYTPFDIAYLMVQTDRGERLVKAGNMFDLLDDE